MKQIGAAKVSENSYFWKKSETGMKHVVVQKNFLISEEFAGCFGAMPISTASRSASNK